jgi:hypothetical protein
LRNACRPSPVFVEPDGAQVTADRGADGQLEVRPARGPLLVWLLDLDRGRAQVRQDLEQCGRP